jgi:carboxypeptidase family protein/TonB-dependent receptor-like protein
VKTMKNMLSWGLMFLLLAAPITVVAQSASTGALTGTVIDSNKAVVRDVQVKVTNEATGEERIAQTQDNGSYNVPLLLPGSYRVELSKTGFKSAAKAGLRVNVSETARLDVELEVGEISTTINVAADAEVLQTESSELGRVVNREAISNLPLVNRNYTQIVTLSPGVSASVPNATELGRGSGGESGGAFRAHGAFARDNNFQMNGVQINDLQASGFFSGGTAIPNPDAIEEFKVQTGQFDATFGRNAGANVNVVTKSGANNFHGTVFEFLRNDVLNANDFFRNRAGQDRGVLKQNQFGFTLGGPVKKDKLLFFGSYQGTRQVNGVGGGSTSNFFSPPFTNDRSRAALGRMFAGRRGALQGTTGPAILADGSNISSQALELFNLKLPNGEFVVPTPQSVDLTRPFDLQGFSAFSVPATFDEDQFIANLDFLHTDKSKIWGRFFSADSDLVQSFPVTNLGGAASPGFPLLTGNTFRIFSVAHSYAISSTLINQAEFGFHRIDTPIVQQEVFEWADIGVTAPTVANMFPALGVQGSFTIGGNGQSVNINQNHYTFQDSLTYVRGRHTLRFGGAITRTHLNLSDFTFLGGLVFLSWPDVLLGLAGGPVAAGGNGTPFSNVAVSVDIPGDLDRDWRVIDGNAYIQDDFKVSPSLTLNLGLRYERLGNLGDIGGRNSGFDPGLANPNPPAGGTLEGFVVSGNFPGTVPAGVTQLDNRLGIRGVHQSNWAPRFGFAWRLPETKLLPFTDQMVLRGGYGIYYSRATGQPFIQLAAGPPFAQARQVQVGQAANTPLTFANPFGPEFVPPQFQFYSPSTGINVSFIDQEYRAPVTQQFSLNLQTDLGRNTLLEVGYVGQRGNHLIFLHSLNQANLASPENPIRGVTTNTVANVAQRVPIRGFAANGMNDIDSVANSWYHGMEVSVTKRLSKGLQFLAAYTFAHAYSDAATNTSAAGGGVSGNQNDRRANYGRADFNREHRLVVSYVYELPSPERFHAVVDKLLGGWSVAGVTTIQSGLPLSFTGTNASNVFGTTGDRAQLAPGCGHSNLETFGTMQSRLNNYFNRSCIARNAAGTAIWPVIGTGGSGTGFGNSGVGIAFGPGQNNTDVAVIKRTAIGWLGEAGNFEFRTEFFNAFNTPQFGNPSTNVSSAAFGTISGTSVNPRIIQFGLKVNF